MQRKGFKRVFYTLGMVLERRNFGEFIDKVMGFNVKVRCNFAIWNGKVEWNRTAV
jgi:hypothetical protein